MPRRWLALRYFALAALLLWTAGSSTLRSGAAEQGEGLTWARLGPLDPKWITTIAPSPDWPADGTILLARSPIQRQAAGDLARTRDGGRTWEPLPLPASPMSEGFALRTLMVVRGPDGAPAAFALSSDTLAEQPRTLYRSLDAGTSWDAVLSFPAALAGVSLAVSPNFAADGLAFAGTPEHHFRTRDFGATWAPFDPAPEQPERSEQPGQLVQQIVFSPGYARDGLLFAAVVSAEFPPITAEQLNGGPAEALVNAGELSRGVLVSRDGGDTWEDVSAGLEVDGAPYRHVQSLVVSPTFAEDQTLFAFAWGPRRAVPDGAVQRFEAGLMLFLVHPDGSRTIQVLGVLSSWSEYPD